jgi:hypothetical protein
MTQTVAEERLVGLEPSGARVQVIAAIGLPYQVSPDEWACPVSLAGLHDRLHDIHGGGSLQALCLAVSLLRQLLTGFVEGSGRLFYADGKEPFSISSCFSGVGSHQ